MEESNPFGVDQNLRTSTLKWQRSTRGESHFDLENQKVLFHHFTSHFRTPVKLQMTFGPCQEASYTAVTLNPESNITRREIGIIPYSTEIHWRIQNCSYKFGCQAREAHRWLLEYRWVLRLVRSLDMFDTFYSIGRKTSRRKYVVLGEIDEKTVGIQGRLFMARSLGENGKESQAEGEVKVSTWEISTRQCTKIARNLVHFSLWQGIWGDLQECTQQIGNTSGFRYALQDQQE